MVDHRSGDSGRLLSDEARRLYRRLLVSRGPLLVADCPEAGLGRLLDLGLARLEDEGVLAVAPWPAVANLAGVLDMRTRAALDELAEISEFLSRCMTSPAAESAVEGSPVRVITDREQMRALLSGLYASARHSYCSVQTSARIDVGVYHLIGRPAELESRSSVVSRIVVDPVVADEARAGLAAGIKRGEHVRRHPAPPLKFILVDSHLAVLPLDEAAKSGVVVLNSPALGGLLAWTFEHLWGEAKPLSSSQTGPTHLHPTDIRIVRMLADDATDATIATALGISERSLRRHIATLADTLGVHSRQGTIAAAFRLGILV